MAHAVQRYNEPLRVVELEMEHTDIRALQHDPLQVVGATQRLHYSYPPTSLPVPVQAIVTTTIAAPYSNLTAACLFRFSWGTPLDVIVGQIEATALNVPGRRVGRLALPAMVAPDLATALFDNALMLSLYLPPEQGELADGDPQNTAKITLFYALIQL